MHGNSNIKNCLIFSNTVLYWNVRRVLVFLRVRALIPFINENFQISSKAVTTLLSAWGDMFRSWTVYPTLRTLQHYLQLRVYNVQVSYFHVLVSWRARFLISGTCFIQGKYSDCRLFLRPQFVPHRECSPFLVWRPVKCMYIGF